VLKVAMTCTGCGTDNRAGRRFCRQCGAPLALQCSECGAENEPDDHFCGGCGAPLTVPEVPAGGPPMPAGANGGPAARSPGAVSERRLVSVLFADLVGFTTLSEHRDPEEVRELLSRYFERCRSLIERYGGTVEKFIGDAVMAVWGTPVAREDDAERAVRAALSLTGAVALLGEEVGLPALRVRAGVLTGSAAVEVGAEGEGMVLGDTVNTASRLQSIAEPGTVLVDDVTRRASQAAIEYEDAGEHQLRGRQQPVRAWTALRVVAGVGGTRRSVGLEAPLVGRGRELEQLTESFERSADEPQARLVSITGEAGYGKSRLLWEFYKYIDGVERVVLWHQGRCLSYGDGVAYWALADMVRARAGITEDELPESARSKLAATVAAVVPEPRERRLVEPRLAHLIGLERGSASDRVDLFSGWRLFFERLSEQAPVVLAFEDLQWADSGLLDFIDYLLDWSPERPLFILALGRPELLATRPDWRGMTVGPLDPAAMRQLLDGLVPGLPDEVAGRIVERAEGVPLYAVETVRMLLDRRRLVQAGSRYRLTGELGELEVPETLHALAAARLDSLPATERSVLQDAAVFGQSFTAADVAALSERSTAVVAATLDALTAKQVLAYNDDPLSAERGQYHFLQGLLRTTAYGTLSRRDRKHRHLAAARHLQESLGEGAHEVAEILAAHFLDAARAAPDAPDAAQIRAAAQQTLAEAGERALSLALGAEAQRAFDHAAELAGDELTRARMLDRAGRAAASRAAHEAAEPRLREAIERFEALGEDLAAARAMAELGSVLFATGHLDAAIELEERAVGRLPPGSPARSPALATMAIDLAFLGRCEEAIGAAEEALTAAEPQGDWPTICQAFTAVAVVRKQQGRHQEGEAMHKQALAIALAHDLTSDALRAYNNVADGPLQADRFRDAIEIATQGRELATRQGNRSWQTILSLLIDTARVGLGDWDSFSIDAYDAASQVPALPLWARIAAARGDRDGLAQVLAAAERSGELFDVERAPIQAISRAIALRGLGRDADALAVALPIALSGKGIVNEIRREAMLEAGLAALALDDEDAVARLIDFVAEYPPALRTPLLRSHAARFAGHLAARRGETGEADRRFAEAARAAREVEAGFVLGQILLDHGELLVAAGRPERAEELLDEARAIFGRLRAAPYLQRASARQTGVTA
jgi:class 3 adenylate cyclase/predicted ATPase